MATLGAGSPLWRVYLAWIPMMIGMASTMIPLTSLIMSSVPPGRAGVGSAMNDTTRELGGALGVAVLGSVVATMFTSSLDTALDGLPAGARDEAGAGLAGALGVARGLPGEAGPALADAARSAFLDGLATAALTAAAVVAVTAVSAWRLLPREASEARTAAVPAPDIIEAHG